MRTNQGWTIQGSLRAIRLTIKRLSYQLDGGKGIKTMTRKYEGGKVIKEGERYILTGNRNTWDTNYHLVHKNTGVEYLLDIEDVGQLPEVNLDDEADIQKLIKTAWLTKMSVSAYERMGG